jgi:LysR family glycine cleavage system transcriptional activator
MPKPQLDPAVSTSLRALPSMRALGAFATAARLGSFSKAGAELGMTQSAVSHQIRMLEEHLGQPLFNRLHRNAVLTDAGRDLEITLRDCFDRLELGLKRLEQYRKPNQLILYTRPAFAQRWLLPRLAALRARHPELDLWLFSTDQPVDLARGEIHLAILPRPSSPSRGETNGIETRPLFGDWLTPVCAPAVARRPKPLRQPADLLTRPLLHDERREDWTRWFAAQGSRATLPAQGYNFGDSGALLQAAQEGLGVALGSLVLAAADLEAGSLVTPLPAAIPADQDWCVSVNAEAAAKPKIQRFLQWLEGEAAGTRAWLADWTAAHASVKTSPASRKGK